MKAHCHMHRIETGPVALQSCFCPGFRVFHCCEGCGDKWASYHPCVTDMNNGQRKLPRAGKNRELNKSVFPWELPASLRFAEGVYIHIRNARMVVCPDPFTHCSTHPSQQQTSQKQRQ